jgi:hypothetical protein
MTNNGVKRPAPLALSLKKDSVINMVQMMEERGIIERCQVKAVKSIS